MIYNAYITSGTLKPTKFKTRSSLATGIRIIAGLFIACGLILGLVTVHLYIIPVSIFTALIVDALAEIIIMLKIMVNQEYELKNVTMQIETDDIMPVSIIENNDSEDEYYEDDSSEED